MGRPGRLAQCDHRRVAQSAQHPLDARAPRGIGRVRGGGEAQVTDDLAVCAGISGPGNLHLINGLHEAHRSRVPVPAIAAQIPSREIGSNYFQETYPETLFRECSGYCEVISHASQVPRLLEIAIQTAIAKRDVAVVVLTGDVAFDKTDARSRPAVHPSPSDMDELVRLLNKSQDVTILGGAGCIDAHAEQMSVAGKLKAPIIHAFRGKEHIERQSVRRWNDRPHRLRVQLSRDRTPTCC